MNREYLENVSMPDSMVNATNGTGNARAKRVHDRLGMDSLSTSASPEESLVIDDRCDVRPAQMVETKLTRVLGGGMLPVSHLQMRSLLRQR